MKKEINTLELEAKDWEVKGLENIEVCTNYQTCKLMIVTAQDALKRA